jgi:hypothetical protein
MASPRVSLLKREPATFRAGIVNLTEYCGTQYGHGGLLIRSLMLELLPPTKPG